MKKLMTICFALEPGGNLTADSSDHQQRAVGRFVLRDESIHTLNSGSGIASSLETMVIGICGLRRFISIALLYSLLFSHYATSFRSTIVDTCTSSSNRER